MTVVITVKIRKNTLLAKPKQKLFILPFYNFVTSGKKKNIFSPPKRFDGYSMKVAVCSM
jgi:hypothetical protein